MRRAIIAILSTAAGTTLLVGLKAGLLPLPATANGGDPSAVNAAANGVDAAAANGSAGADDPNAADDRDSDDQDASESPAPGAPVAAAPVPINASPAKPLGKLRNGTFTGPVVQVKYGPVQVRVTVTAGRLTDVAAVQLPSGDEHSVQVSGKAGPTLRQEALTAQSATIQSVSGATYTSAGYRNSLQAALDAAKQA